MAAYLSPTVQCVQNNFFVDQTENGVRTEEAVISVRLTKPTTNNQSCRRNRTMKRPNHHQYETLAQPQTESLTTVVSGDQSETTTQSSASRSGSPLQKSFSLDLGAITSTSSRNQTLFTITRAGTHDSRNGLYVRPSWKEILRSYINRKTAIVSFILLVIFFHSMHSLLAKSSSSPSNPDAFSPFGESVGNDNGGLGDDQGQSASESSFKPLPGKGVLSSITKHGDTTNLSSHRAFSKLKSFCRTIPLNEDDQQSSSSFSVTSCGETCANSLTPLERTDIKGRDWKRAYEKNKQLIDENDGEKLDIVFFGDSITEEWNGRWYGKPYKDISDYYDMDEKDIASQSFVGIQSVFRKYFNKKNMKGLALGIAGDTIPQLLYRIQNDELSNSGLDSKVYWLLIGTNDLSHGCSEEAVFLGIVKAVEEIRKMRPDSIVVINGLLPRTGRLDGTLMTAKLAASRSGSKTGRSHILEEKTSFTDDDEFSNNNQTTSNMKSNDATEEASTHTITKKTTLDLSLDYWESIVQINRGLEQYAHDHDKVEYFDASDIFIGQLGNKYFQRQEPSFLMSELMLDYLHPTTLGHELWAQQIVDYIISDLDTPFNL